MSLFQGAYQFFEKYIPSDHTRQACFPQYLDEHMNLCDIDTVVDLGCGAGDSIDFFRSRNQNLSWIGIDIPSSPEVNTRTRTDAHFISFDGIHLPLHDKSVDLVYSRQVFEHVRFPQELLREIKRVLRPGGSFIGSTSHLEPYHSYSYWNYTPYGFLTLIENAGMELQEFRPGIDVFTICIRKMTWNWKFLNRYFSKETPMNKLISILGFMIKKSPAEINLIKLILSGQFYFVAKNKSDS